MTVTNGLYSIQIDDEGRRAWPCQRRDRAASTARSPAATRISITPAATPPISGKWRGELITNEHTRSVGVRPLFGGREVTCGFTGGYTGDGAEVNGTALVGKTSVSFHAKLTLHLAVR